MFGLKKSVVRIAACTAVVLSTLWGVTSAYADTQKPQAWRVCAINPWVEAYADQLPSCLTKPLNELTLSGPKNDWLTGAAAIASDDPSKVTVQLNEPKELKGRIQLRVLGTVGDMDTDRLVYDPLISKEDLPDHARAAKNFEEIKDFPTLTVMPKVPAFLWITVDLTGVSSGVYEGSLTFTDPDGNKKDVPLTIKVLDAELPVKSPLNFIAWQWWSGDRMIKDFVQHGINTAWRDQEQAWKDGANFLVFQMSSTFNVPTLDDKTKANIKKELDDIWQRMDALKVPLDCWAINTNDEVSDETAKQTLINVQYIKSLRPKTPIWLNPAWGKKADSAQNWTTTDGCLKVVAPIVDIWCPYSWHLWDNTPAFSFMKSTKKRMWYYEIWGTASRRPTVGRESLRTGPWLAWHYDLSGWGNYCANNWPYDPWSGQQIHSFTYPGTNGGVISSRGFEALREGTQEYKRLYMIKKLGGDKMKPLLDSWTDMTLNAQSVEVIDAVRDQMDKTLVNLSASKKK